jgi:hypothetical protein
MVLSPAVSDPSRPASRAWLFALAILAGAVIRVAALPLPGTEDVGVWKIWSFNASKDLTGMYGIGGDPPVRAVLHYGTQYTTVDYPPLALYELGVLGIAYRGLFPTFPNDWRLVAALKLPGLLAGALLAALVYDAVRRATGRVELARAATLAVWLNPAIVLNAEILGYLDPLMMLPAVLSLVLAHQGRPTLAGCALAAAALTKPQGALMLPAVLLAVGRLGGGVALGRAVLAGAGTTLLVFLPYILVGAVPNALNAFWSFARRDLLSAQAANVWWIANWLERARHLIAEHGMPGAYFVRVKGVMALSTFLENGWPNPRPLATAGILATIAWGVWRMRQTRDLGQHAALAALTVHAYYTLGVAVHEHHILLALPLLAIAAALHPQYRALFAVLTVIAALGMNMFYGIGRGIGWAVPRGITGVDLSVVNSFANVAAFVWFLWLVSQSRSSEPAGPRPMPG